MYHLQELAKVGRGRLTIANDEAGLRVVSSYDAMQIINVLEPDDVVAVRDALTLWLDTRGDHVRAWLAELDRRFPE